MYNPEFKDFFISSKDSYEDVRMLQAVEDKSDKELYAAYLKYAVKGKKATKTQKEVKSEKAAIVKKKLSEIEPPYFPSFFLRRKNIKGLEKEYQTYHRIYLVIDELLYKQQDYKLKIEEIENYLVSEKNEDITDIQTIIKVLIAEKLIFEYKKDKNNEYLCYSNLKADSEKSTIYYGSLAEELRVKSEKISLLVSHGQTVGNYREYILREMLRKYIPSKYKVATGFIEGIGRQIDILIYDSLNHAPTFIEGELVVVKKEAVRGIIEVKSNLITAKLKEALDFFYSITYPGIFNPDIPIFKGIFSFDTTYTDSNSIANYIKDFYTKPYFNEEVQENMTRGLVCLFREISCVTVLNKFCVFSQYMSAKGGEDDNFIPKLLSISDKRNLDVQTAMFLSLLFDYLDVDYYGKKSSMSSFSRIYNSKKVNINIEANLVADDWTPNSASKNEHDFTAKSVKERIEKIHSWFNGEISTTDYLKELHKE
ncbi:DUF6602 domain-containing protein [Sunxiuqinia elliptica]|uniref:DUF6602 domain-containing protein n=1 Tax=Sunxiuqinia elliptica TaxID=655355 RepID=A0A4R6GKP0_9BACT|nr:DUF6602 domain-containing protein [Sunxiuqinia elliptica]TDN95682.1 hypothetical protein DET52_1142 [Sunxiuqinia elliptica]TDO66877.1 hypothetical protein DET65_0460 [Sunxiuqinia elliptica]